MKPPSPKVDLFSNEWLRLVFLVLLASTIFFSKLGLNGMANYDDCFYAQKAKEMLQAGNWQTQTFNHVVQFGNAPLHLWLVMLAYKAFGISVYAAKFPSAFMALLTVLLVYFLGRYLFDPWVGFGAGFVLATTYTFFKYARHCMLDLTLAFFCTLAMVAVILAFRKDQRYFLLWGLSIGLAFLTKSALGLFPLIVTFLFIAWDRQWKVLTWPAFWGGLVLQLGTMGWWCYSQYQIDGPKFLDEHLKGVILEKAYMGEAPHWYQHFSFLTDMLMFNWLWVIPMAGGLYFLAKRAGKRDSTSRFLLIWCLTLPVLMSLVRYRMPWYLMQVFPALALAAGLALKEWLSAENERKGTKVVMIVGTLAVVLINALPYPLDRDREKDTRIVAPYVKYFGDKGAKIIGFRDNFYGLNNSMLFFSDHAADPIYQDANDVEKEFAASGTVLCVAHKSDLADIQKSVKQWHPVKYADDLVLISNQLLRTSDMPTWKGYD